MKIAFSRISSLQAQTLGLALTRWWDGYSTFEDFQQALAAGAFQRLPPSWLLASLAKNDMEKLYLFIYFFFWICNTFEAENMIIVKFLNNNIFCSIYHLRYWKSIKPDSRRPFEDLTQAQLRVWAHVILTIPKYEHLKKWDSQFILR